MNGVATLGSSRWPKRTFCVRERQRVQLQAAEARSDGDRVRHVIPGILDLTDIGQSDRTQGVRPHLREPLQPSRGTLRMQVLEIFVPQLFPSRTPDQKRR